MDIDEIEIIRAHVEWKKQFQLWLETPEKLDLGRLESLTNCALGKWILCSMDTLSVNSFFNELVVEHEKFHAIVLDLAERAKCGESVSDDPELVICSQKIISLIVALKKQTLS